MSSGMINLEENLPDIIHAGSSAGSNSTPFKLPTETMSKKTPHEYNKSENFIFSPDVLPAKQTRDFFTKNQKQMIRDSKDGGLENPFGLTSRESADYQHGTSVPDTRRKFENLIQLTSGVDLSEDSSSLCAVEEERVNE
jgi:hypothetical protein